jgi:hypothetical protein
MCNIMERLVEMKADRKANQAKLKGMMNATQERMDANTKAMREDIKSRQAEIRSIVGAFQEKMDACVASRRDEGYLDLCGPTQNTGQHSCDPRR